MQINRLYLKNFRRFDEAQFAFSEKGTLILGPNAVGKTTLLEAIHILIFGRSFRAISLNETIQEGKTNAGIEIAFTKEGIEHTLGFYFGEDQRKIRLNRSEYKSVSSLIGLLLGASLLPSDIHLISGQPQLRRQFLDYLIAQLDPLYLHHLVRYAALMKNRNALLKNRDFRTIDFFEEEMAKSASYISLARKSASLELDRLAKEQFNLFGERGEELSVRYIAEKSAPFLSKEEFLECFQKNRPREAHIGFTIVGPQKDDLELLLSGKECKLFSSEGQKRSASAALKLASWVHLKTSAGANPLLLVDDAGLGFDRNRKERFFNSLQDRGQVLITSAEEDLAGSVEGLEVMQLIADNHAAERG